MTDTVLPLPAPVLIPVEGSAAKFPVRRIFCVGRNYAAHAREMGSDPKTEPPFFFTKPADAVLPTPATMPYPPATKDLQHEIELVVAIGKGGADIEVGKALDHVWGYAIGLDMTRRDLQGEAKKKGHPWDMGKGFDLSAPIGPLRPVAEIGHPTKGEIQVSVNGAVKQKGDLADLIWSIPEVIAYLSSLVTLAPGDLIYSGTPEGVGPVVRGDLLEGSIDGVGTLSLKIG